MSGRALMLGHPVSGHFAKCNACLQVHCVVALPFMLGLNKVMRDDGILGDWMPNELVLW